MIRRLLLVLALALGAITAGATSASAAGINASNGNIACVYNIKPLNIGLCLGI